MDEQKSEGTSHEAVPSDAPGNRAGAARVFVLPEWLKPSQPADSPGDSLRNFSVFQEIIAPLIERVGAADRRREAAEAERDHFRELHAQAEAAFTGEHGARLSAEANAVTERHRAEAAIQRAEQAERERQRLALVITDLEKRLAGTEAERDAARGARQRAEEEAIRMRKAELSRRSLGRFARLWAALHGD
jgi:hypothetical protein